MRSRLAFAAALVCALTACNRNLEPYVEGEEPREPDLARIFPDAGDGPGTSGTANAMGGPKPGGELPSVRPGQPAPAGDDDPATIRGRIEIPADLAGALRADSTLFVIARRAGTSGGPPLAVRRIPNPSLPYVFAIGPQHAMIQGIPFAGPIALTARLDGDGDAMTRRPGDLAGDAEAPVEPGSSDVTIVLDQRI